MDKTQPVNEEEETLDPHLSLASDEVEDKFEPSSQESSEVTPEDSLKGERETEESFDELNNRYLRLRAEYDNFRKRTQKEKQDFFQFATADLMEKLLPTLDSMDRGIEFSEKADSLDAVKEGLVKVHRLLWETLERKDYLPSTKFKYPWT